MNTDGGVEIQLHKFLISILDGGEVEAGPRYPLEGPQRLSERCENLMKPLALPIIKPFTYVLLGYTYSDLQILESFVKNGMRHVFTAKQDNKLHFEVSLL